MHIGLSCDREIFGKPWFSECHHRLTCTTQSSPGFPWRTPIPWSRPFTAQRKIRKGSTWWPFLWRKRSTASTDMRLLPIFPTVLCIFPWPALRLDQNAFAHGDGAPQQATGLPALLALRNTEVSQVVGLIEPLAMSSLLCSLPLSFLTLFALYDCFLYGSLWWKQLIDFGCCQWMVYKKGMGK